jgi:predicted transcriptional regulator
MQRITLTLDTSLAESLRQEARRDDRPVSSVARKALTAYFARMTPARPASATRRATKKRGAQTNLNHA